MRKKIGQKDLQQHLRFSGGTSRQSSTTAMTSNDLMITAGEEIAATRAVCVGADGLVYMAGLSKPASAISAVYAPVAELVTIKSGDTLTIEDAAFAVGATVWLSEPDAVTGLNMTTTAPTVTAGQYAQRLGRALTSTMILIEISDAEVAE